MCYKLSCAYSGRDTFTKKGTVLQKTGFALQLKLKKTLYKWDFHVSYSPWSQSKFIAIIYCCIVFLNSRSFFLQQILLLSCLSEVLPPATMAVTILCVLSNNIKTPLPAKMTKKNPSLSLTAMFGPSRLTCHERSLRSSPSVEATSLSHLSVSATLGRIYNMSLRDRLSDRANARSPQRLRQPQLLFCYTLDFQNQLWQSPRSRVGGRCKKMKKTVEDSVANCAVLSAHDPVTLSIRKKLPP